jgi:hypothetical protein
MKRTHHRRLVQHTTDESDDIDGCRPRARRCCRLRVCCRWFARALPPRAHHALRRRLVSLLLRGVLRRQRLRRCRHQRITSLVVLLCAAAAAAPPSPRVQHVQHSL